jgi:hypothetical protein
MVPLKQIKASEKELKKSTRGICSAQRGIARWCSGQRNDLTPIKHSRLWIPRGRETCRQEFESPPGYQTPEFHIPLSSFFRFEKQNNLDRSLKIIHLQNAEALGWV